MPRIDMRRNHKLGMAAVLALEGYCHTHLPRRLYELVKVRASHANGCRHCIDMHTRALRKDGEDEDRIAAASTGALPHPLLDDRENAALALTDAVTRLDPQEGVPDEVWDEAARHLTETELGNLVLGIATINVWNRIAVASRLEP